MTVDYNGIQVDWPGYSTIRLEMPRGLVLYLDPGRTDYGVLTDSTPGDADYILISHTHHYDPQAIHRVAKNESHIYIFNDVIGLNNLANRSRSELVPPETLPYDITTFDYEAEFTIEDIGVTTIPAYNLSSPEGLNIRPDGTGLQPPGTAVGFLLDIAGTTVLWPGDTDFIEEHRELSVDLLLAPISQLVTMNRREAAELAESVTPELVVPVHYSWDGKTPDGPPFLIADPEAFRDDVLERGIDCELIT